MWGYKMENGTWTGIVGMVTRREAEVGVSDIAINGERVGAITYSMPVAIFHYKVFIRIEEPGVSWNNFLAPFSIGLWLTTVVCSVIIAIVLNICHLVDVSHGMESATGSNFARHIFRSFGILFCLKDDTTTPLSVQSRVTDVLSYILGSVLFCAYSAAVISFLTVRKTNLPFTNLEQLHKAKSYKVGAVQASSTLVAFTLSKEALARDVFRVHLQSPATLPTSVLDGLQRVCHTSRYAFMVPLEEAAEHVPHLSCAVVFLPQNIFEMAYAIVINNHSPYIDLFRHTCVSH
ncbi:glutamate receptor ionotropic, kainate glr-3-like [Periplaneta americana]|uniref:glutamate receptor ionotropic, kainate glr-3-like n=1 Tax=Periplaneta americana TaxID=6978 RepID=UPI0037E8F346